jgi:hypothetical protein
MRPSPPRKLSARIAPSRRVQRIRLLTLLASIATAGLTLAGTTNGVPALPGGGTGVSDCFACNSTVASIPTVALGSVLGMPEANQFWAIADQAPQKLMNSTMATLMNATPLHVYRYDGAVDSTNSTTGVNYSSNGVAGRGIMNDSQFVQWCKMIRCSAMIGLPAEIDDPGAAAYTVRYVETTLNFTPTYWSLGNEPGSWTHYGIPWTHWRATDLSTCGGLCYAQLVQKYVVAIHKVDASARIVGLQDAACNNNTYLWETALVDGKNLSALACHLYPENVYLAPTPAELYSTLQGSWSLPVKMAKSEAAVHFACPRCDLPLFVDEYNAAYFPIAIMATYSDAVFMAASMIQALELNLSQFAFFSLADNGNTGLIYGLIQTNGTPSPTYYDYADFAENLPMHKVVNATIGTKVSGIYSVETVAYHRHALFVVNTNVTNSVTFTLQGSGFGFGGPGVSWRWGPLKATPSEQTYTAGSVPYEWHVPPQGMLLIDVN